MFYHNKLIKKSLRIYWSILIFNNKCEKVHLPSSKIEDKVGINQFFLFLNKAKTNNNVQLI